MFPWKRDRPRRPPWFALALLFAIFVSGLLYSWTSARGRRRDPALGSVERLVAPRKSADAAGRTGDLVLTGPEGASVTVGAAADLAGHRRQVGAILDLAAIAGDVEDPLILMRTVMADAKDVVTELAVRSPQPFDCKGGGPGVRMNGAIGVALTSEICALPAQRFSLLTRATSLAPGSSLADEVEVGRSPVVVERDGAAWDLEHDTSFLAVAEGGTAFLLEARMHVSRTFSHFGAETFPSPVLVRYGGGDSAMRTLTVVPGDVLHALARLPAATRLLDVTFGPGRGGHVSIQDDAARELASGTVLAGETRTLRLPPDLGTIAVLRDDRGVVTDSRVVLPAPGTRAAVTASVPAVATLALDYRSDAGAPLPVHVLFAGQGGTADPAPTGLEGRAIAAGRSLYLPDGRARLSVAPGRYRVTGSHGPAYSLSVKELELAPGSTTPIDDVLRRVVDTSGWLAADFHLHSAPSPDSTVSLKDRVLCLVSEGIDLAVATDHNRITDLGPEVSRSGFDHHLATLPGVEITSAGHKWGHFNAFPLPVPAGAPEEGVPVYLGKRPAEMFGSARELGARVVQVNHARMEPSIGYFDLVHLDMHTGHADPIFSSGFDVLEAYNGMWIERREKVREGALDLVALARRGQRVAATGNSDSHRLLFQEAGWPRTWVHTPSEPLATRAERTIQAVLRGDTTISSGPFVELTVDGHGIGSVVVPGGTGSVSVKVRVSAPAWVPVEHLEIFRDDVVLERFSIPVPPADGVRLERELEVPVEGKDAVIFAWADADAPLPDVLPYERPLSIGFTGLVYVDGDRNGSIAVPPGSTPIPPASAAP